MSGKRLRQFLTIAVVLLLDGSGFAFRPNNQAVTYASFQYVNYVATSQAKVYFATTSGITVYNKLTNVWEEPLTGAEGLDIADVKRIWVDRFDEHLYAEVTSGIYEYNFTFGRWILSLDTPSPETDDRHIPVPQNLTPPFAFNYLGNGTLVDADGRSFALTDVVDDGDGNLWIGSWGYGAFRAGSITMKLDQLPYGLLQDAATTMYLDDSLLWVGGQMLSSRRTGVSGLNSQTNQYTYVETGLNPDLPATDINCISGNQRYLILGTVSGVYFIDRSTGQVAKHLDRRRGFSDDNVISLQPIGEDTLFIGTTSGLLLYQYSEDVIRFVAQKQFFNRVIYDLAITKGYLWIASNIGAYRYALEDGRLQKFQDPDQILFNRVFAIKPFGRDIWFLSDNGLVRLDLDDASTTPYHVSTTRLDYRAMAVNDSIAAVSSENGITLVFLNRGGFQTRDFSVEDGLASTYVYDLLIDGDYLWIGTDKGLTRFLWNNPDRID